jgi:hypothetical protein
VILFGDARMLSWKAIGFVSGHGFIQTAMTYPNES